MLVLVKESIVSHCMVMMVMINKYIVGVVEMESVLENNYTAVTIHMIILLLLLGIHRQSVVDNHSVNQLMVIKCTDVMWFDMMLTEIII